MRPFTPGTRFTDLIASGEDRELFSRQHLSELLGDDTEIVLQVLDEYNRLVEHHGAEKLRDWLYAARSITPIDVKPEDT